MKALALLAAAALSLSACAGFTSDQAACVITGLTSADKESLDLAKAQALAADCGVTVQAVVEAVMAEAE